MSEARLSFFGAVGTVTGSKHRVEYGGARMLVDCGLFQGFRRLRLRDWASMPFDPARIDAVALTHAHLDHSGYLPLLFKRGFAGPVLSTPGTRDLCEILLPDSGFPQEKDAEFANRHGFSKHKPALPLYTRRDAEDSLKRFHPMEFGDNNDIRDAFAIRFLPAGHILGAAIVEVTFGGTRVVFSGDLGRPNDAIMVAPTKPERADHLVIEPTYGDRLHDTRHPDDAPRHRIEEKLGWPCDVPEYRDEVALQ